MTAIHYDRVRRVRRLPVPLPPKPRARPLGPPVLFCWEGVDICVRDDIDRTGRTWDEFLDEMADLFIWSLRDLSLPLNFLDTFERLVSHADLETHRKAMHARLRDRQEKEAARSEAFRVEVKQHGAIGAFLNGIHRALKKGDTP